MEEKIITSEVISGFEAHLVSKERSGHTIAKYLHDVRAYAGFLGGREVSSETTCGFKQELIAKEYAPGHAGVAVRVLQIHGLDGLRDTENAHTEGRVLSGGQGAHP